jgi:putative acetyltransferase
MLNKQNFISQIIRLKFSWKCVFLDVKVRQETKGDSAEVLEVVRLAFNRKVESQLVEKFRQNPKYIPELSLVAEYEGHVIGHILFFPIEVKVDGETWQTLILAPLSVHPSYQRRGVGGELVTAGLVIVKQLGYHSVLVVGHPEYYPRFGFRRASEWGLSIKEAVPSDAFMAIELVEDGIKRCRESFYFPMELFESAM